MQTISSLLPDEPAYAAQPGHDGPATGSIHGEVVGSEGLIYNGASVELVQDHATGPSVRKATSDSSGRFDFAGVAPGPFQLSVSSQGFTTKVISGVLSSGENYEAQPIVLPLSALTSEVRVIASAEQIAQAQVSQEEKQRILGIIPNFYTVYAPNPAPLNSKQKFSLAWRSILDPVAFATSGAYAGVELANGSLSGYGQGAQGYAKRFGANYADTFIGTMISSALLPSLLKQDPRYFYKGTGTIPSRALYAIANAVISKGDNGHWEPAYSGIIGGLAAGGISNLYCPAQNRSGVSLTFENALTGIAGGAVQNLFQEFLIRKFTRKVPSYSPTQP